MTFARRLCAALVSFALVFGAGGISTGPARAADAVDATAAPPPPSLAAEVSETVARLTARIDAAEKSSSQLTELGDELGRLRVEVEAIQADSGRLTDGLLPQLAAVRSQIEKLGPPPGKDAPAEAATIGAERARLNASASALDGAIKATQLTWVRAQQLSEKVTVLRHALFAKNLLQRVPSPLLPGLWREVASESPAVWRRIAYLTDDWAHWAAAKSAALGLLLAATFALFCVLKFLGRRLARRPLGEGPAPRFFDRAAAVAVTAPLRALPAIASSVVLYGGLEAMDLLYPPWARIGGAIIKAVVVFAAVTALAYAVLCPGVPRWRLLALPEHAAHRVRWLTYAIAGVYVLDAALTETSRVFLVPLSLSVVQALAATLLFTLLLIGLLLTPVTAAAANAAPTPYRYQRAVKLPLWLIAIAMPGLALTGYVALARFVAQQVIMTGSVVMVGWLIYLAIRAITRDTEQRHYPIGALLETRFGLDAPRRNQLARLTEFALSLALVIGAVPVLLLQWGFSGADIRDGFLLFGMQVGQFHVSVARILLGVFLFIGLLFATRLVQRWLRERALQQTRLDPSIVNSIETVVGYAGTAIAALLAVSYAGLDISNFAVVAGALSVGIGFGLQSIVNNFVSGLILLIERPIKVGDWIVLGSEQGNVRRISVRATEIETFDRASLIIPNSELITGRVLNWTHRNSMGRVILRIGVGYQSDPDEVMGILKACARAHPGVLGTPEPVAAFENFGESALQFSLRVYLADISQALSVQSDLRVAMLKELRAAGIEIPFNQIDINVRSVAGRARGLAPPVIIDDAAAGGRERSAKRNGKPAADAAE